jgi:glycine/D-amino acid oxidase-like deaminating enzyme
MRRSNDKLRVAVVGAGIIGSSIAFHLSRAYSNVTIVDRLMPGSGASGSSFAWLNSFGKDPPSYHELNRRSMDMWERFARRLDADIGIHWGGELRWTSTIEAAEELERRVSQLQVRGYATRLIDRTELARLEPGLSPGEVTAAAMSDGDGHVDPPKVVRACLDRVVAHGGVVRTNTEVTGLRLTDGGDGGRVRSIETADGDIDCDVVVLAAGVCATGLAATVGVHLPQQESPGVLVRTSRHASVLCRVSALRTPPIDAVHGEIHLRQNADGTVLIGESAEDSLTLDDSQEHADELLRRATHFIPALSDASAMPVPVAHRPMPLDGLPMLGFTQEVPNLYVALTHSGVTLAPLIGELGTIEIVDGATVDALAPYRPDRFRP